MQARTHHCGELRTQHVNQTVSLAGWVNKYRDHGGVIFIDIRDRNGVTQLVFRPSDEKLHTLADRLRNEDVIWVKGTCIAREEGMANPKLSTGEIEIEATELDILNKVDTPPFTPDEAAKVGEETRLRYRYIDLRQTRMQKILKTRHRVTKLMRDYFDENEFLEIVGWFLVFFFPFNAANKINLILYVYNSLLRIKTFFELPVLKKTKRFTF